MALTRGTVLAGMVLVLCAPGFAQSGKTAPAARKAAQTGGLPQGAVATTEGTWTYTDKEQRKWIYSKTPFGYMRTAAAGTMTAKRPSGVPADAVVNADGNYLWTAPGGRKWRLVVTPFGVSRLPADDLPAEGSGQTPLQDVVAIEKGERVRFELKTPMGISSWEKKKSEMTTDEKRIFAAQSSTNNTGQK